MQTRLQDDAWAFLDAVYHDFAEEASTIIRALPPDDKNELLWFYAHLLRGCMIGTENRRKMEPGGGLRFLRSQIVHPSEPPCG